MKLSLKNIVCVYTLQCIEKSTQTWELTFKLTNDDVRWEVTNNIYYPLKLSGIGNVKDVLHSI